MVGGWPWGRVRVVPTSHVRAKRCSPCRDDLHALSYKARSSPSAPQQTPAMPLPDELTKPIDVLLIDNFDSFTWNLYQSLSILGADVTVIRNDAISVDDFPALTINSLIISPGPGHPATDSGISRDAIKYFTGKVPILGICMGLECLVDVYGGKIASVSFPSIRLTFPHCRTTWGSYGVALTFCV